MISHPLYSLHNFDPKIIDRKYLTELSIDISKIDEVVLYRLEKSSKNFIASYQNERLHINDVIIKSEISNKTQLPIHKYNKNSKCPSNVLEMNPVVGCSYKCLYCLATSGVHDKKILIYSNYPEYIKKHLEDTVNIEYWYYLGAKTDAFQDVIIETGLIHSIIKEFILHYKKYPKSKKKLFIVTKGGIDQIEYLYNGKSIINLLSEIKERVYYNISIGIMPDDIRTIFEPKAPFMEQRIKAFIECQRNGINANHTVLQPIIETYLNDGIIDDYLSMIKNINCINFKPEFLTVTIENLAVLAQVIGYLDKSIESKIYKQYLPSENQDIKKNGRTAPNRKQSLETLIKLKEKGEQYGLTMSICCWVREAYSVSTNYFPIINNNKYLCDFKA